MGQDPKASEPAAQEEHYRAAVAECGRMVDRLTAGYEADADKRRDLRQEIHLQLWRSFAAFDGRCSLKTWTLRVAHNTAASYVLRERRMNSRSVSLEEVELSLGRLAAPADSGREQMWNEVQRLILQLAPLDRQIIISYLEDMDAEAIAEVTGLTAGNVAMKIHRTKKILAHRIQEEGHLRGADL